MAKSFIYPVATATITDGAYGVSINGGTTYGFASSNTVTNEHRISDDSIGSAVSSYGSDVNDTIQFDLGGSYACDVIAIYLSAASTANLALYYSSSAINMGTDSSDPSVPLATSPSMLTNHDAGWNIRTFTEITDRYWYVRAIGGDITPSEIIIGKKYDFDANPDINSKFGEEFNTDINISYGGDEYACKRHEPKSTWEFSWDFLLGDQKTALESLNSTVQDNRKFIYYDETSYHYVIMGKPLEFTEVAPSVYSTSMTLREQLA